MTTKQIIIRAISDVIYTDEVSKDMLPNIRLRDNDGYEFTLVRCEGNFYIVDSDNEVWAHTVAETLDEALQTLIKYDWYVYYNSGDNEND